MFIKIFLLYFFIIFSKGIAAFAYIVEEKVVKMQGSGHTQPGLVSVLFWTSLAQFLTILLQFWVDIIPGFGYTNNVHEFIQK